MNEKTLTPETQVAANQVAQAFNTLHRYLESLQHRDENGAPVMTFQITQAHIRLDECAMWAVKHVLAAGVVAAPQAEQPAPANEGAADVAPMPAANASGTEPV